MSITYESVFDGDNIKILATKFNGNCHFTNFLDKLSEHERKKLKKKIDNIFILFDKKEGKLSNKEKFRTLRDFSCNGCKEFKINQIRISFVQINHNVFLLDVFKKKQDKWPGNKIQKTEKLCTQVQEDIKKGGFYEF